MARTTSIIVQNLAEIELPVGYCFYSQADFSVSRLQGRHVVPIKVKFGRATKFHLDRLRGVGLRPRKLWKFGILPILLSIWGESLAWFLQNLQGLCTTQSTWFRQHLQQSINNKIINNLPRRGRFQPNFRLFQRLNYLWDPKNVTTAGTTSIIM